MIVIKPDVVILSLFDENGVYKGPPERKILFQGELIDIDEYATANGLTLPDAGD